MLPRFTFTGSQCWMPSSKAAGEIKVPQHRLAGMGPGQESQCDSQSSSTGAAWQLPAPSLASSKEAELTDSEQLLPAKCWTGGHTRCLRGSQQHSSWSLNFTCVQCRKADTQVFLSHGIVQKRQRGLAGKGKWGIFSGSQLGGQCTVPGVFPSKFSFNPHNYLAKQTSFKSL